MSLLLLLAPRTSGGAPSVGTVAAKLTPVRTLKPATTVRTFNA
jgi:hypothetical protein